VTGPQHADAAAQARHRDHVLTAMADPTRRQLLAWLADRGPATATALATELPMSRQAVVKHLAVLRDAELVDSERSGREVRFAARPASLAATANWLAGLAAQWDARLAAIKRIAESAQPERPG
jgi:DNA-binding transcriptional ArsR family regulator